MTTSAPGAKAGAAETSARTGFLGKFGVLKAAM